MSRNVLVMSICLWTGALQGAPSIAQDEEEENPTGWFNSTELSAVVTEGNSKNQAIGFKNLLRRRWSSSAFRLRAEATKAQSADDSFGAVDPGTVAPGVPIDEQDLGFILVEPGLEPNVDVALLEGRYDRNITERFFWHVGAGWDRNDSAGIIARYQVFAGVGNVWFDREGFELSTAYGLSYNDVEEKTPDPGKDPKFAGLRFESNYLNAFGAATEYRNNLSVNTSLSDLGDFRFDMINSIRVKMTDLLALQLSLQWLYQNRPALEDIDLVLFTDADGNVIFPCGGNCNQTTIGKVATRKKKLDTIFNVSLVVSF